MGVLASPRDAALHPRPHAAAAGAALRGWLAVSAAMVFVMVILGGLTRLTHSGLSMVAWQPFHLAPPLTHAQWEQAFAAYRLTPQYRDVFPDMTLSGFQHIFWLEYVHRLWGRAIGAVFLLPYLWFLVRGALPWRLGWRLGAIFTLGGLQGLMGWLMVSSGLEDRPEVSPYRLAAHLLLGVLIFGLLLWTLLDLAPRRPAVAQAGRRFAKPLALCLGLVIATMAMGAFTAGTRAGFAFNTFPLMDGRLVPPGLIDPALHPAWRNLFENIETVQFVHRWLALTTVATVVLTFLAARRQGPSPALARRVALMAAMAVLQATLGIATLLLVVPTLLASLHQAGALTLFALTLAALHESLCERP